MPLSEIKKVVREVFVDKLGLNTRESVLTTSHQDFLDNNIGGLLSKHFDNSSTTCSCFPEYKILEWEFAKTVSGFWENSKNREQTIKASRGRYPFGCFIQVSREWIP